MYTPSASDLLAILPYLVLVTGAGLLLLLEAFLPKLRRAAAGLTLLITAVALGARLSLETPGEVWSGMLRIDRVTTLVDLFILGAVFLTAAMAGPFLRRNEAERSEFYALLLFAATGAMIMASATDALVVFLGLELLSIPLYVLNAFMRRNPYNVEAGLKYFVVGAFASGFLVYGIALLYGATATTNLVAMGENVLGTGMSPLLGIGLAMVIGALAFKLALFPCHGWAPDVYEGGPTPVTAFLSVVPKAAALVTLLRIVDGLDLIQLSPRWFLAGSVIAVASMTLGNLAAINQIDVKRMLAYSGIAHMGYAMVAILAAGKDGGSAVLVYIGTYTLMNVGAFAAVALLTESDQQRHFRPDLAGQGWRRPVVALALSVCLFSLAGLPPFVGFTAKFMVFKAAIAHGYIWLAVLGVINSLISAYYYLRVVYVMYMQPLPEREPVFAKSWAISAVTAVSALAVVVVGIFPTWLLSAAEEAILFLVG